MNSNRRKPQADCTKLLHMTLTFSLSVHHTVYLSPPAAMLMTILA